jgi:hypothetical protein
VDAWRESFVSKFKDRDRVKMTSSALKKGLDKAGSLPISPSSTGVVISISKDGRYVFVLRDNRKAIQKYSIDFWELEEG